MLIRSTLIKSSKSLIKLNNLSSKKPFDGNTKKNDTNIKQKQQYDLQSIILDNDEKIRNSSIQGYSETSFVINNQTIDQPIIAFKNIYLLWDIKSFNDITIDSLSIIFTHHPTVELLLLGLGKRIKQRISKDIIDFYKSKGIVIDVSTTFNASSTFNILLAEDRNVAIAAVPDDFFINEK